MKVVVSQPMFFPWIGLFEQISLSDVYVHLDDVQMPGGSSFINRVQLKGASGKHWWTIPTKRPREFCKISEVIACPNSSWIKKSLKTLEQIFSGLPYKDNAVDFFRNAIDMKFSRLSDFNIFLIEKISNYLGIQTTFKRVNRAVEGQDKTANLLSLLKLEGTTVYISGLGGLNYLQKDMFDEAGIDLLFMKYEHKLYKQSFGNFDPYVSVLHPIAALGKEASSLLVSSAQ